MEAGTVLAQVGLKRTLGFWQAWAMSLGLVACSTTLMMISLGFGDLGAGFTYTHLIALCYILLVCLALSELATAYPKSSSFVFYTSMALGRVAGLSIGLWYGFKDIFGFSAESAIVGIIMEKIIPQVPWWGWAMLLLTLFTIVNMLGITVTGRVQLVLVSIMAGSYLALALLGFIVKRPCLECLTRTLLDPPASSIYHGVPAGLPSILALTLMGVWLFVGVEVLAPLAEEVKNPSRTLPLAMVTSMVILFALKQFLGLSWVASVPREILLSEPYHVGAVGYLLGPAGEVWMAIISLVATGSTVNAVLTGATRVLYGMAVDGYLPSFFSWLHPKFRAPWGSLCLLYALMLLVLGVSASSLGTKTPSFLALICSFVFMLTYLTIFIDVIVLRVKKPDGARPSKVEGPLKLPIPAFLGLIATFVILIFSVAPPFGDVNILIYGGTYCLALLLVSMVIYTKRLSRR
ncbi:MAG: APC family permease [Candidatus Nezhaarchaeales archaeon]